jgi:thiamine-monophosphate kinase
MSGADEFAVIARHFAPLAASAGARCLADDAALLDAGPWVVTTDVVVEGVHFLPDDPIGRIAQKALRVNLSDLAAKGAAPAHYLLALQWPAGRDAGEIAAFAAGLAHDQGVFNVTLLGGDTTATPGPLAVTITAFGRPHGARTPARSDATPGDDVWVTGTIGDGVLGLAVRQGAYAEPPAARDYLVDRYQIPGARVAFAAAISRYAHAAMDVSDGLLGDAARLAAASAARLVIDPAAIPLSSAARGWLDGQPDRYAGLGRLACGGDDYEILFTAAPGVRAALAAAADDLGLPLARIGRVEAGAGVEAGGLPVGAHRHRLGK